MINTLLVFFSLGEKMLGINSQHISPQDRCPTRCENNITLLSADGNVVGFHLDMSATHLHFTDCFCITSL